MIRLSHESFFSAYAEDDIRKMLSFCLASMIERILGTPDADGNLTDVKRVEEFMKHSKYFKPLIKQSLEIGKGPLTESIRWVDLFREKYSDILAKLKDRVHEYTFNELGEALLFEMVRHSYYVVNDEKWLKKYHDELDDKYSDGTYDAMDASTYSWRKMGTEEFDKLEKKIAGQVEAGLRSDYGEVLKKIEEGCECSIDNLDDEYDDPFVELYFQIHYDNPQIDADAYIEKLTHAYMMEITDYSLYLDEAFDEMTMEIFEYELGISLAGDQMSEMECISINDLLWDYDYTFILELMPDQKRLDQFLKTVGEYAGFVMDGFDDVVKDESDICCDISNKGDTSDALA